jgi:hypothetical protein
MVVPSARRVVGRGLLRVGRCALGGGIFPDVFSPLPLVTFYYYNTGVLFVLFLF